MAQSNQDRWARDSRTGRHRIVRSNDYGAASTNTLNIDLLDAEVYDIGTITADFFGVYIVRWGAAGSTKVSIVAVDSSGTYLVTDQGKQPSSTSANTFTASVGLTSSSAGSGVPSLYISSGVLKIAVPSGTGGTTYNINVTRIA